MGATNHDFGFTMNPSGPTVACVVLLGIDSFEQAPQHWRFCLVSANAHETISAVLSIFEGVAGLRDRVLRCSERDKRREYIADAT
jgi:hypothetical protein